MSKAYKLIKNGRPIVYEPTNSRAFKSGSLAGYVYEHIIVTGNKLGRPIKTTEVIHHIDGDKTNNSEDNLLVLQSNLDHTRLHKNHMSLQELEKLPDGAYRIKDSAMKYLETDGHKFKLVDFVCTNCGKDFTARPSYRHGEHAFCSRKYLVAYNTNAKLASITKEELESILERYKSYEQAAKYFGVSGRTVSKYCKLLGAKKPA